MAAQPDLDELAALVAGEDAVRESLTQQAVAFATNSARQFTGWYDTGAITTWATELASNIEEYLLALARMVDGYLTQIIADLTGGYARPVGAVDVAALRAGITHAGAYGRVADTYRYQQAQLDKMARNVILEVAPTPPTLVTPIEAAVQRAADVANLDSQLTLQRQSHQTMAGQARRHGITGWRRIVHPELSKTGTCGLCIAASDRIYHTGDLMPLHAHCHCLPMPVTADNDPGGAIDEREFGRLYGAAGSTSRADLKRTRYQVNAHGELGPLLNPPGRVRTARQAKTAENRPPRRPNTPAQNLDNVRRLHSGLVPALQKLDELAANDPDTWAPFQQTVAGRVHDLAQQLAA